MVGLCTPPPRPERTMKFYEAIFTGVYVAMIMGDHKYTATSSDCVLIIIYYHYYLSVGMVSESP